MKQLTASAPTIIIATTILLFGVLVWPTPFETVAVGPFLYRVTRLTGNIEQADNGAWKSLRDAETILTPKTLDLDSPKELGAHDSSKTKFDCRAVYVEGNAILEITVGPVSENVAKTLFSKTPTVVLLTGSNFPIALKGIDFLSPIILPQKETTTPTVTFREEIPMSEATYRSVKNWTLLQGHLP
jgi:hypothetical protein